MRLTTIRNRLKRTISRDGLGRLQRACQRGRWASKGWIVDPTSAEDENKAFLIRVRLTVIRNRPKRTISAMVGLGRYNEF